MFIKDKKHFLGHFFGKNITKMVMHVYVLTMDARINIRLSLLFFYY